MNEQIERLTESCQEFINALCEAFNGLVDNLYGVFESLSTGHSGAIDDVYKIMSEYEYWLAEKKWKESENQKVFESKINNFKPNKIIKIIQINKRFSPKNWTGKNFKRAV